MQNSILVRNGCGQKSLLSGAARNPRFYPHVQFESKSNSIAKLFNGYEYQQKGIFLCSMLIIVFIFSLFECQVQLQERILLKSAQDPEVSLEVRYLHCFH
jgi:hypothetical protein